MGDMSLPYLAFDGDNHYYEALDAFTRHLDPALGSRCVQWCEIDGRKYHVVGGRVSHAVVNPTSKDLARPGMTGATMLCPRDSIVAGRYRDRMSCLDIR